MKQSTLIAAEQMISSTGAGDTPQATTLTEIKADTTDSNIFSEDKSHIDHICRAVLAQIVPRKAENRHRIDLLAL